MARTRDYKAERQRRNVLARQRGFSSLDALHKARRRGEYPTAKEIRTSAEKRKEAERISAVRLVNTRRVSKRTSVPISEWDKKSQAWSDAHARQDGTMFKQSWPEHRRAQFYQAFVAPFQLPNDERMWDDVYDYMEMYPEDFDEVPDRDDDPYRND